MSRIAAAHVVTIIVPKKVTIIVPKKRDVCMISCSSTSLSRCCYFKEILRMTKAPWPSPSLKLKVSGMVSNGSKVSVKSE